MVGPAEDEPEHPGVLEDLQDQAEWSSYSQDIPRLGNRFREAIRLARDRRAFRNVSRPRRFRSSQLWAIARVALLVAGITVAIVSVLLIVAEA